MSGVNQAGSRDDEMLLFYALGWMVALAVVIFGPMPLAIVVGGVVLLIALVDQAIGIHTRYRWTGWMVRRTIEVVLLLTIARLALAALALTLGGSMPEPGSPVVLVGFVAVMLLYVVVCIGGFIRRWREVPVHPSE